MASRGEQPDDQLRGDVRRLVIAGPFAWLSGVAVQSIVWRQLYPSEPTSDWWAVNIWTGVALMGTIPFIFLPAFLALRALLGGHRPRLLFVLAGGAIGAAPAFVALAIWGLDQGVWIMPEMVPTYCVGGAAGLVLGGAFVVRRE